MSYDECEIHDEDATNGCETCRREAQSLCDHLDATCNDCGAYFCGGNRFIELSLASLELGLRWLNDRAREKKAISALLDLDWTLDPEECDF
jgi:hypothetical protein